LALGAGADQEQLRANLFGTAATVYRGTLDLDNSLKALMLVPRSGVPQPRDSAETLIADYGEYMNSVNGLTQLVRIWDRVVLAGVYNDGILSSQRLKNHYR